MDMALPFHIAVSLLVFWMPPRITYCVPFIMFLGCFRPHVHAFPNSSHKPVPKFGTILTGKAMLPFLALIFHINLSQDYMWLVKLTTERGSVYLGSWFQSFQSIVAGKKEKDRTSYIMVANRQREERPWASYLPLSSSLPSEPSGSGTLPATSGPSSPSLGNPLCKGPHRHNHTNKQD